MAQLSQPGFLANLVNGFTSFDQAHGFAVNLIAVIALAVIGAAFLLSFARNPETFGIGRLPLLKTALIAFSVLCLLDWVLIEDLGFFGGLGTDPNSMIPMILLAVAGYLALTRPAPAQAPAPSRQPKPRIRPRPQRPRLRPETAFRLLAEHQLPLHRRRRRGRRDPARRRPAGDRPGQPERRPDPGPGDQRRVLRR